MQADWFGSSCVGDILMQFLFWFKGFCDSWDKVFQGILILGYLRASQIVW